MSLIDISVPTDLEGTKSVVRTWLKQPGQPVAADEAIVELETDKVAMEVFSPAAGILTEIAKAVGEDAEGGALLGRIEVQPANETEASRGSAPAAAAPASAPRVDAEGPRRSIADFSPDVKLSPSVRRLLLETGLDPVGIEGTGRGGRLTRADVLQHIERGATAARPASAIVAAPGSSASRPPAAQAGAVGRTPRGRLEPHDTMRRRIAEHLTHSLAVAPHVTAVFEADFGAIMAHRARHKTAFAAQGVNLTYTAYVVMACVQAMRAAPAVNSRWTDDAIEHFDDVNIGVGTALGDKGLIVPVVHQAHTLNLLGVASRLQEMTEKARAGRLAPADVQGGTFTISNHGVSGSLLAAPIIINQPQSAILGVGKLEKRVVVQEVNGADVIAIRPRAYVSLSIDHRVLDGHQTNGWLTRFCEVLERWPLE